MIPDPAVDPIQNQSSASERQTSDWDIRNAPRNYISLVGFQIGTALFSFGAVWLITRYLGSEGYGGIVAIIAASQVAQVLVNWTSVAVVRFGVDEFIETQKIARTFWIRLIVLTINLILVLLLADSWFPLLANWLKLPPESFWLVIAHIVVTALWIHVQMSLQGAKMPKVQGVLQMVERLLIVGGLLFLIATAMLNFYWVVAFYIAAPIAMALVGIIQLRPFIFARFSMDRVFVKKIMAYSLPLLPMTLVGYFSGSYLDAIFVSNFLSTRDLGIYSVATQINGMALQLPTLANSLLLPLFVTLNSEGLNEKIRTHFTHTLPSLTLAWGFLSTLGSAAGFFLIPAIFGQDFSAATTPFWILVSSSVAGIPVLFGYAAVTHSSSSTYIAAIATILAACVNIALNFLLIPRFGLVGCAWATVIAYSVSMLVFAILLNKRIAIPFSWSTLAILPNIVGALVFSYGSNVAVALTVGIILSGFLLYVKRKSVTQSVNVLKRVLNERDRIAK